MSVFTAENQPVSQVYHQSCDDPPTQYSWVGPHQSYNAAFILISSIHLSSFVTASEQIRARGIYWPFPSSPASCTLPGKHPLGLFLFSHQKMLLDVFTRPECKEKLSFRECLFSCGQDNRYNRVQSFYCLDPYKCGW